MDVIRNSEYPYQLFILLHIKSIDILVTFEYPAYQANGYQSFNTTLEQSYSQIHFKEYEISAPCRTVAITFHVFHIHQMKDKNDFGRIK